MHLFDFCIFIGSADISIGATDQCPESPDPFLHAGDEIHPAPWNRGLVYETKVNGYHIMSCNTSDLLVDGRSIIVLMEGRKRYPQ